MKRERITLIIIITMTVAFFITLLWGYGQYQQNRRAMTLLENEYQRAYYNYLADVKEMAITAGKAQSAGALQRALLLDRLSSLAGSAADHMSQLPVQHSRYQRSVAYLNQVGDYAASLGQKLARGETLPEQDQRNLSYIYAQLQDIYAQMAEMEQAVSGGSIVFAAAVQPGSWWQAARLALLGGSRAVQGSLAAEEENTADGYFSRADALLDKVELLSYDGKYSAHMSELPARGLYGKRRQTAAEAIEAAREFLAQAGWPSVSLFSQEEIDLNGALPLYSFRFSADNGEDIYITVSRAGGKIISYVRQRAAGPAQITAEEAVSRAQALLTAAGYDSLQLVSRQSLGNELLLGYVHVQEETLYYPDQVNVKIAMDNGEITALNSREYWMNHRQRPLPANAHSVEEALAGLGGDAIVSGTAAAFISNGAGGEIFCHEICHTAGGEQYLTYIGAEDLMEEQVLRGYVAEDGSFYTR